jgi:hypothetical protein
MDLSKERDRALGVALELSDNVTDLLANATKIYGWLVGPASMSLAFGPIVDQATEEPIGRNGSAMTQMRDDQKVRVSLTAQDAKGADVLDRAGDTTDDPAWTSSDENVFTWDINSDNPREAWAVAGVPGSAVGTVTIGEISATVAIDVVAGDIALVALQTGDPEDQ